MSESTYSSSYRAILTALLAQADIQINGSRPHDIQVHDERFFKRFMKDSRLGLGESYMDGWWDCAALDQMLLFKLFRSDSHLQMQAHNWKFILAHLKAKLIPDGSTTRSWLVGKKHYDLGNDLFAAMLDKHMVYTSGVWADGVKTLDESQDVKLEMICRKLKLEPGMTLLDIGCGWGGLCIYAAKHYGVKAVGISISKEQLAEARERAVGLQVEFRFQDYRLVEEKFDRITSIEMFEHVGLPYYSDYFRIVRSCLKEDGIFVFQTGGINVSNYTNIWMNKLHLPRRAFPLAGRDIARHRRQLRA